MRKRSFPCLTVITLLVVVALDRLSKAWVVENLPFEVPVAVVPGLENFFTLTYIHNRGAAFGMLPQAGDLFALVQMAVVIALFVWYSRLPVEHVLVRLSIGMVQGGAIGNLIDRLTTGYVVDFIHFHFFPIFNVADSAVTVGVIILAAYLLFAESGIPEPEKAETLGPDGRTCA